MSGKYSTLQRVTELLCEQRTTQLYTMMSAMSVPVERHFFASMSDLKSKALREGWVERRVAGSSVTEIHETLCWPCTSDFITESCLRAALESNDDHIPALFAKTWDLCRGFCGQLACSALLWRSPPWSFLGLVSESAEHRRSCLSRLQHEYKALMRLESEAISDACTSEWLHDLHIQQQVFVREVFVRLEDD
eukprot:5494429-Amphidinium_carterae.2